MSIALESRQREPRTRVASAARAWHRSAPGAVRRAYAAGRESQGWKAWRQYLRTRKPTAVGQQDGPSCLPTSEIDRLQGPDIAATLRLWLDDAEMGEFGVDYAASALAWSRRLPQLAAELASDAWWQLLDHLLRAVAEVDENCSIDGASADRALVHQMLAGELALTLACQFPEITACRKLLPQARRALGTGLSELLDGKGLLHARHLDQLRLFLACWTRCRAVGRRLNRGCWSDEAEKRYRRFVGNALRLARRDASHVFSDVSSGRADADLLDEAAALAGIAGDRKRLKAAVHSEWASVAVLRPDWSRAAPRLSVLYPDTACRIELGCGKDVLCSGTWGLEVRVDGVAVAPTSDWTELCWVSDKDVDYLELEIDLGEQVRVQRHFVLARKDSFLLLADAVLGTQPASMEYRGTLPLNAGIKFREACETRETTLAGRKPRATVLPLALPEWLADRRVGQLRPVEHGLELQQAVQGRALFAPLFLDLSPARMNKRLTWRRLSVAESHTIQPADAAVGYRVAIGKQQWLIYRSLSGLQNRSLLGHNLRTELLVARFDRKGEVESLIEIE